MRFQDPGHGNWVQWIGSLDNGHGWYDVVEFPSGFRARFHLTEHDSFADGEERDDALSALESMRNRVLSELEKLRIEIESLATPRHDMSRDVTRSDLRGS
jgi:hypothetical protein